MANIWLEHLEAMRNNNENNTKQRFKNILDKCDSWIKELRITEATTEQRQEIFNLMSLSIQLQTSIAILTSLEEVQMRRD